MISTSLASFWFGILFCTGFLFGATFESKKLKLKTKSQVDFLPDGFEFKENQPAYGIIDPDYAKVFTMARCLAWTEGYCLAMHGSFTRDLDLIAIPWTKQACEPEHLIARICDQANLVEVGKAGSKEHGRLAYTLRFEEFGDPRFIDISIMPRAASDGKHPDTKRLDFIESEYIQIDSFEIPTGGDDAEVGWTFKQHYQGQKEPVSVHRHYKDDIREGIDHAMVVMRGSNEDQR